MQFANNNVLRLDNPIVSVSKFDAVGEDNERSLKKYRVYQLFSRATWILNLQASLVPPAGSTTQGQIQFCFKLKSEHTNHASLLRGLMALAGTRSTEISFSQNNRAFHIVVDLSDETYVAHRFGKALFAFEEEVAFKRRLNILLNEERKLKDQIRALYQSGIL